MRVGSRWLLFLVYAALAACSTLPPRKEPRPVAVYLLDETGSIIPAPRPVCGALSVSRVRSAPGYRSARMVYMRNAHEIEFFAYHQWVDTPAAMLQAILVNGLEGSGRFEAVLPADGAAENDLRLDTELERLRQRFMSDESVVELVVRARLFAGNQFESRTFRIEEGAGNGPEGGVAAANQAAGRWVESVVSWIDEVVPKWQDSCRR